MSKKFNQNTKTAARRKKEFVASTANKARYATMLHGLTTSENNWTNLERIQD